MNTDFINLTTENLASEHLCCIIRSKKHHPGEETKILAFRPIICKEVWL